MRYKSGCDDSGIVFTCKHVIGEKKPILYASKDEKTFPEDTGWQFLCGGSHIDSDARIVSLKEVLEMDASIRKLVDFTEGEFHRKTGVDEWKLL